MVIRYNAPVSLTFSLISLGALVLGFLTSQTTTALLFSVHSDMRADDILSWLRLFTHVLGHKDWEHLMSNLAFLLLLGPILEEKYGSGKVLIMTAITALVTGLLHVLLGALGLFSEPTSLLGASGIVFMFILLTSFTNIRSGEIPLTFVAIVTIYLVKELIEAFKPGEVSHFAHIIGGALGSLFGFFFTPKKA